MILGCTNDYVRTLTKSNSRALQIAQYYYDSKIQKAVMDWACVLVTVKENRNIYSTSMIHAPETSNLEHKKVEGSINVRLSLRHLCVKVGRRGTGS